VQTARFARFRPSTISLRFPLFGETLRPMQLADPMFQFVRSTLLLATLLGALAWVMIRAFRRSDEPGLLGVKWVLTAIIGGWMVSRIKPFAGPDPQWQHVVTALIGGLALAAVWRRNIGAIIARPFGALYDGGDQQVEPRPFYSIAEAKRKKGRYTEAVAEIRKQLERFPNDFTGQLTLAEIQAENLNDLPGAELTIHRLCEQPGHTPRNLALAWNTLADWQLKFAQDRDAARAALQQIIDRLPETDLALAAARRIAHLASTEFLLAPHDRQRIHVPQVMQNLGLLRGSGQPANEETDPAKLAAGCVKHLEEHPLDTDAREKLAVLYADHYGRLDLAADQLEQLIEQPAQPARLVVHWLNLLADLQLRHGADEETVRRTLGQIIERFPAHSGAEIARGRLERLPLEMKGKEKSQSVKLGTYEQNIGLKRGLPRQL